MELTEDLIVIAVCGPDESGKEQRVHLVEAVVEQEAVTNTITIG